mgnify:CR=1 FL=1
MSISILCNVEETARLETLSALCIIDILVCLCLVRNLYQIYLIYLGTWHIYVEILYSISQCLGLRIFSPYPYERVHSDWSV